MRRELEFGSDPCQHAQTAGSHDREAPVSVQSDCRHGDAVRVEPTGGVPRSCAERRGAFDEMLLTGGQTGGQRVSPRLEPGRAPQPGCGRVSCRRPVRRHLPRRHRQPVLLGNVGCPAQHHRESSGCERCLTCCQSCSGGPWRRGESDPPWSNRAPPLSYKRSRFAVRRGRRNLAEPWGCGPARGLGIFRRKSAQHGCLHPRGPQGRLRLCACGHQGRPESLGCDSRGRGLGCVACRATTHPAIAGTRVTRISAVAGARVRPRRGSSFFRIDTGTAVASGGSATTPAYILYTSGSTGSPKGVQHTHASALAFVSWAATAFDVMDRDRLSCHAPLHFDPDYLRPVRCRR